jgi:CRP-like cAMP-binding protein
MSENLLLANIPKDERHRLDPFLTPVELELDEVIIEPDEPIKYLYFLYDAVSSTIQDMEDGSSIEIGLMGVEGLVGIQLWLGVESTTTRTVIQIPGRALRMTATDFKREVIDKPSPLNQLIAKYVHAFLVMTSTAAACNRLHTLDQRLCRWLKLIHNRVRRDEFPMRHEYLAQMLGVHRPTVSINAKILQTAGLISYVRGNIKVLDSEGLKEGSCECLELMESQFDRIFNHPWRDLVKREDTVKREDKEGWNTKFDY